MLNRPQRFEDVVGHKQLLQIIKQHIASGTLPHFILLVGEEGLGKTTLAKLIAMSLTCTAQEKPCYMCEDCKLAMKNCIKENKDTSNIKSFNMSIDGGKDAAKSVVQHIKGINAGGNKVLILDEAHGLSSEAQDVFLVDTEYLPDNIYVIMCTTEDANLKKTLRSRAVTYRLNRLSTREVTTLLKRECENKRIRLQHTDSTLNLIATWAECKPRKALKFLEALGKDCNVDTETVRNLLGYVSVDNVIPIFKYLGGSISLGLSYLENMDLGSNILDIALEAIKIKMGGISSKLSMDEQNKLKVELSNVDEKTLIKFAYKLSSTQEVTRTSLINAFLMSHVNEPNIVNSSRQEVLTQELTQRMVVSETVTPTLNQVENKAPTLEALLKGGYSFNA